MGVSAKEEGRSIEHARRREWMAWIPPGVNVCDRSSWQPSSMFLGSRLGYETRLLHTTGVPSTTTDTSQSHILHEKEFST